MLLHKKHKLLFFLIENSIALFKKKHIKKQMRILFLFLNGLTIFVLSLCILLTAGCGAGAGNKNAELESLKKQQATLAEQIKTLEKELGTTTSDSTAANERHSNETPVEVIELSPQAFKHFLEIQGSIDCKDNIGVSPKQPGIIAEVFGIKGQQVQKGDVLATLDDAIFQQGMQELYTNLEFARTIYAKQKALWDKQIGTEVQYLQAKNNVETLERKLATLQEQADLYKIKSPISGVIDQVNAKVGEGVMTGMPAFRVVNMRNMKVLVDVAENYTGKAKTGNNVEIFLPDLNKTLNGKIGAVGNIINPINRTFSVEINIPNSGELRPNMIAMVKLQDYGNGNAVVVPLNAIQNSEEGAYVFLAEKTSGNNTFVARKQLITTGMIYGEGAEVTKGLKNGDKIVVTGQQDLVSGQPIKF